jgi:glycerol uptake facilitator protein
MSPYFAEFLGTLLLVLFGDGVVANVVLTKSKGQNSGWIVITVGWAMAVIIAVYAVNAVSGAHINPAVTIALAVIGKFKWSLVPGYVAAQMAGAFVGATLVWIAYLPHWRATESKALKLAAFCTGPAVQQPVANVLTEIIATAALAFGLLAVLTPKNLLPNSGFDTGLGPVLVGLIVLAIGLSLGGPTGFAINPARDLGARIAHAVLPVADKGSSDWGYAWVPVVGPILGGVAGALLWAALWGARP